jgi:hypothetical protein
MAFPLVGPARVGAWSNTHKIHFPVQTLHTLGVHLV